VQQRSGGENNEEEQIQQHTLRMRGCGANTTRESTCLEKKKRKLEVLGVRRSLTFSVLLCFASAKVTYSLSYWLLLLFSIILTVFFFPFLSRLFARTHQQNKQKRPCFPPQQ
jgi:Flp pilus assembly protein TadB